MSATIARENAAIQKRSYEITERMFKGGADSALDLQQARTQDLATLSSIPQLELTLMKTRNALCILLGRPPGICPNSTGWDTGFPASSRPPSALQALDIANKRCREGYADFQRALFAQEEVQLINHGNDLGSLVSLHIPVAPGLSVFGAPGFGRRTRRKYAGISMI